LPALSNDLAVRDVVECSRNSACLSREARVAQDAVQVSLGMCLQRSAKGADAIVMKYFISAWNDEDAMKILHNCREALPPHGKIILCRLSSRFRRTQSCSMALCQEFFAVQVNSSARRLDGARRSF